MFPPTSTAATAADSKHITSTCHGFSYHVCNVDAAVICSGLQVSQQIYVPTILGTHEGQHEKSRLVMMCAITGTAWTTWRS